MRRSPNIRPAARPRPWPALWQAQKQHDYWLPQKAIEKVADLLGMPYIRVLEIAHLLHHVQSRAGGKIFHPALRHHALHAARLRRSSSAPERIGPQRKVTATACFSWLEVECLGACCNAPMVQINDDYYEDLDAANFAKLLDDLAAGRPVKIGSQNGPPALRAARRPDRL